MRGCWRPVGNRGLAVLIVPALIVAVLGGLLAAIISGLAGYGWLSALVAYWLAGNLLLMAMLVPQLLFRRCAPEPQAETGPLETAGSLRPTIRVLVSVGWITLGLAMVFWQTFHNDHALARTSHPHDLGAVLGMHESPSASQRYLTGWDAPGAVLMPLDRLLRVDLWVAGLASYFIGLLRLVAAAAERG